MQRREVMPTTPFNNLVELAAASVARFASRPLFGERGGDGRWSWRTYEQWAEEVDALRGGLAALDLAPGARIAIVSRNSSAWATAAYATYGLGATFVPLYEAQRPDDWEFILHDCGASVVFVRTAAIAAAIADMHERLPALEHVIVIEAPESDPRSMAALQARGRATPFPPRSPRPDDVAGLVYTSGTTGWPKGVMLTHGNLTSNVAATLDAFPLDRADRTVSFLPWAHVYGQVTELHILIAAGASTAFNADVEHLVDDLKDIRPSMLVAVPRIFHRLHARIRAQMEEKPAFVRRLFYRGLAVSLAKKRGERTTVWDRVALWLAGFLFAAIRKKLGGRLRYAISASATLSREVAEFIDAIGIDVYEGYGLTETSPVVTCNRPGKRKLGSVGLPLEGVRVEIDTTRGLVPGEGEIVVHGPNVMKGYHERPDEDARALTPDHGLRTGDLGRIDQDGFLFITGRIKDQYKLENGKYVMPGPLEEKLASSPYIRNVMLYGANHPYNVALVSIDPDAIHHWADEHGLSLDRDLAQDPQVRALIHSEVTRNAGQFRGFERPDGEVLTEESFTVENGLLTPTLKLKRNAVAARFANALEAQYDHPAPPPQLPVGQPAHSAARPAY